MRKLAITLLLAAAAAMAAQNTTSPAPANHDNAAPVKAKKHRKASKKHAADHATSSTESAPAKK